MIESLKQKARERISNARNLEHDAEVKRQSILRNKDAVKKLVSLPGWGIIVDNLGNKIAALKLSILSTSPFRILKCLQIRSEIKSLNNLYSILKTEESSVQVEKLDKLFRG